jgi:electron transfer flavoprotein alpha subunit
MKGVLVVCEVRRGQPRDISLELIGAAAELSAAGAGPVTVAVIAGSAAALAPNFARAGVDAIVTVETPCEHFEPHVTARAVGGLIDQLEPAVTLTGHTVDGAGFAPAVAVERELAFASNVISVGWRDGALQARRGVYGDHLVADLDFGGRAALLMIRAGAYAPTAPAADVPVRSIEAEAGDLPTRHLGFVDAATDGVDITKSDFLLSIGRGVGEEESVARFAELAERVGATLSASRPLVDAGWVASARQVGQSGRTVKPKVYLALGISGAVQHLAGMRDADTIIAVNTDPDAPIFGVADVGAVVDVFEFADALEQQF